MAQGPSSVGRASCPQDPACGKAAPSVSDKPGSGSRPVSWSKRRRLTVLAAVVVIACSAVLAACIHLMLGLMSLDIAVASSSTEGRQAGSALTQIFAAQHPRVRVRMVLEPDRLEAAALLDEGKSQLAIVRSDAAAKDGETLVILGRDAAVLVAPGGSPVDSVAKLRGSTVALLDGRKLDGRLLDLILGHFGIPPDSVKREVLTLGQLAEAARHRRIGAVFVVAPIGGQVWLPLFNALRKADTGKPKTIEIDEAAAIARDHPVLDTIDVPKGAFLGSLPAPGDDITTLSVSRRLVARSSMPDWLAGEITREILTSKPKLVSLDDDLAGIEAPDTDDRSQALPIHPGAAAYLSGNLPSLSDQMQTTFYWLGLFASAAASLSAAGATIYQRVRRRRPAARISRLLEICLDVRAAAPAEFAAIEEEVDALVHASVHAEAHGEAVGEEARLAPLLAGNIRETLRRRRRTERPDASASEAPPFESGVAS